MLRVHESSYSDEPCSSENETDAICNGQNFKRQISCQNLSIKTSKRIISDHDSVQICDNDDKKIYRSKRIMPIKIQKGNHQPPIRRTLSDSNITVGQDREAIPEAMFRRKRRNSYDLQSQQRTVQRPSVIRKVSLFFQKLKPKDKLSKQRTLTLNQPQFDTSGFETSVECGNGPTANIQGKVVEIRRVEYISSGTETDTESELNQEGPSFKQNLANRLKLFTSDSCDNEKLMHLDNEQKEKLSVVYKILMEPKLAEITFEVGDRVLDFNALWPDRKTLSSLLTVIESTSGRSAVINICYLIAWCGPIRLLKHIVDANIIDVNQRFDNGLTFLHIACLARKQDFVSYLCLKGLKWNIHDDSGRTPGQLCFSPEVKRLVPSKYSAKEKKRLNYTNATREDKEHIYQFARNKKFADLQIKLQTVTFCVNTEPDECGDYLIHIIAREGLTHLQYLMSLVRIQKANIELPNKIGMTPLTIACCQNSTVLVDTLICILGANPNMANPVNGWTPLHYAVESNNFSIVHCLIRRGADVNLENHSHLRADDMARGTGAMDCIEAIQSHREQRIQHLSSLAETGTLESKLLRKTDLYNVDNQGNTLLMSASLNNRLDNMETLLDEEGCPIDAQHEKTGRTALAIAAFSGNSEAVSQLLNYDANPRISDMEGHLPLHHGVINSHEKTLKTLIAYQNTWTGLPTALKLCSTLPCQNLVKLTIVRRQTDIVNPILFECAVTGNAEKLFNVLEDGDNVNTTSALGDWPLYTAADNGHTNVFFLMHQNGGDITRMHRTTKNSVLHIACCKGHYSIVKYLMSYTRPMNYSDIEDNFLDINMLNGSGSSCLQLAADRGCSRIVRLLLNHGISTAILDKTGSLYNCSEYQGIQVLIETKRAEHTRRIMTLIKAKKGSGLPRLKKIWLPYIDHNLQDNTGDSPLMVAAHLGYIETVKFLLESAVCEVQDEDGVESLANSVDSGAIVDEPLDRQLQAIRRDSPNIFSEPEPETTSDRIEAEFTRSMDYEEQRTRRRPFMRGAISKETLSSDTRATRLRKTTSRNRLVKTLSNLFLDQTEDHQVEEAIPAGAYFKRMSYISASSISHVCKQNQNDGQTVLHRAIQFGDNLQLVELLIEADKSCVNIQDLQGFSPLHLACNFGRKRITLHLAALPYSDLNVRTHDGALAEELTTNRKIITRIQQARAQQLPHRARDDPDAASLTMSIHSAGSLAARARTITSSINVQKIEDRFNEIKRTNREGKDT